MRTRASSVLDDLGALSRDRAGATGQVSTFRVRPGGFAPAAFCCAQTVQVVVRITFRSVVSTRHSVAQVRERIDVARRIEAPLEMLDSGAVRPLGGQLG